MSIGIVILFLVISVVGAFVSYYYARKNRNKQFLIITYISISVFIITLVYLTLDLIIVGGIN